MLRIRTGTVDNEVVIDNIAGGTLAKSGIERALSHMEGTTLIVIFGNSNGVAVQFARNER